jgi:hypothetical protein
VLGGAFVCRFSLPLWLAEHRLFLRDAAGIARNRSRDPISEASRAYEAADAPPSALRSC